VVNATTLYRHPDIGRDQCPVARTLELLGQKWTLLVLREAFYGTTRFGDFQTNLEVPRPVLSDRLTLLVTHELLLREPYQDAGQRVRQKYRLTQKGADLLPALVALMQWGDHYLADRNGPSVSLLHRGCGAQVQAELRCAAEHSLKTAAELEVLAGPGAKP